MKPSTPREVSAARVAALVATCVLHAAAFLALSRPYPRAVLPPVPRTVVVRIDAADVDATPPPFPAPGGAEPVAAPAPPPPTAMRAPPRARATRSTAVVTPTPSVAPIRDPTPAPPPAADSTDAAVRADARTAAASAAPSPDSSADARAAADAAVAAKRATDWQAVVLAHLEHYRRYPFAAQRARIQGTADLRFRVDRRGHVLAARIERSSGSAVLDEEAVAVVARAQPLPPAPAEIPGETIELVVPVQFRLRR